MGRGGGCCARSFGAWIYWEANSRVNRTSVCGVERFVVGRVVACTQVAGIAGKTRLPSGQCIQHSLHVHIGPSDPREHVAPGEDS
jgi:hypothetical protein